MEEFEAKLQILKDVLAYHKTYFDAVYFCAHANKDNYTCKKPLTGMVDQANREFDIDFNKHMLLVILGCLIWFWLGILEPKVFES